MSKKIEEGMTEVEIAWEIEKEIRILGAESLSFDTIVASGTNGAKPHHSPTDKEISKKEAKRFLKDVQDCKNLKNGQLDKLNIEISKKFLKKNNKAGIF